MTRALERGIVVCHTCSGLNGQAARRCRRCGSVVHTRRPYSLQRTVALLLTAAVLYVPANLMPIMFTNQLGESNSNTILGGVAQLWKMQSYPVALVILVASVLVPIGKIFVIAALCFSVSSRHQAAPRQRTLLYRVTEFIGKWSMVDVFVVAVLVALVQITGVITVRPGPAALAFAGVVAATMLAAEQFDPRLIWDRVEAGRAGSARHE